MSYSVTIGGLPLGEQRLAWKFISARCGHRVLYFHHVGESDLPFYEGGIGRDSFKSMLRSLKQQGFCFISIREALSSKVSLKGTLSLCSDDGFAGNAGTVFPILKELDIPLTIFLAGSCIDNRRLAWNHSLAYLRSQVSEPALRSMLPGLISRFGLQDGNSVAQSLFSVANTRREEMLAWLWDHFKLPPENALLAEYQPFLSTSQLKMLGSQGVDLAMHSHTHADLSRLTYPELREELVQNMLALDACGLAWQPWLAFPYGRQCSWESMLKLKRELGVARFFGINCHWKSNRGDELLWQRVSIETDGFKPFKDMLLKPLYREARSIRFH